MGKGVKESEEGWLEGWGGEGRRGVESYKDLCDDRFVWREVLGLS